MINGGEALLEWKRYFLRRKNGSANDLATESHALLLRKYNQPFFFVSLESDLMSTTGRTAHEAGLSSWRPWKPEYQRARKAQRKNEGRFH